MTQAQQGKKVGWSAGGMAAVGLMVVGVFGCEGGGWLVWRCWVCWVTIRHFLLLLLLLFLKCVARAPPPPPHFPPFFSLLLLSNVKTVCE